MYFLLWLKARSLKRKLWFKQWAWS